MSKLTEIQISLAADQPAFLSFLLLQTHLVTLNNSSTLVTAQSIDQLSYELYHHFLKMKAECNESKEGAKDMLNQCNSIIETYRSNQQELFQVSKDRLRLVKELKEATDESLGLLEENQHLKKMVSSLQELNIAINERYENMQKQLNTLSSSKDHSNNEIKGLSQEYDSILNVNASMQQDMKYLHSMIRKFQELSLPIRVIKVAFNSNRNLRELVLKQAEKELGCNEDLREIFKKCEFDLGEATKQ